MSIIHLHRIFLDYIKYCIDEYYKHILHHALITTNKL